ncbi:hypothetical protein AB0942_28815 [Streptomyces nodosus]|uniref:hypothetical protein n=1 Tax=Streptomyces nodosus TaxID=40318 RepID=UPI00345382BF
MNERDFRSRVELNLDSARAVERMDDAQARRLALSYCIGLWRRDVNHPIRGVREVPCHVALSLRSPRQFESVSKRAALISDTLVLTDDPGGLLSGSPARQGEHTTDFAPLQIASEGVDRYVRCTDERHAREEQARRDEEARRNLPAMLARWRLANPPSPYAYTPNWVRSWPVPPVPEVQPEIHTDICRVEEHRENLVSVNGAYHDIIGRWIAGAKPLTDVGAAWYLPRYYTHSRINDGPSRVFEPTPLIDFLTYDGRGVDVSGAHPAKSRILRPVVQLEIPVIEGTTLRDFSKITTDEFDSYASFRDFLRLELLNIDPALNAVESEVELAKIGLEISTQVHEMHAKLKQIKTKRSLQVTGAVVGTVSAALIAVYGPALETALTVMGATGGAWSVVNALSENNSRSLEHDKWYYIWMLARKARQI